MQILFSFVMREGKFQKPSSFSQLATTTPMRLTQRRQSFAKKRSSMLSDTFQNRRGFAEIHPSGRLRRVLVLYTGGTIGMMPSSRGYVCRSGYLPKLLESLPMFHDPEYDLASEEQPVMIHSPTSRGATSGSAHGATHGATNSGTSSTTTTSPMTSPTVRTTLNYNEEADAATPTRLDKKHLPQDAVVAGPLITPVSEFGRRTLYYIKEYEPLLDSCNMHSNDWARVSRDVRCGCLLLLLFVCLFVCLLFVSQWETVEQASCFCVSIYILLH